MELETYQQMIGSLLFIALCTRPDILSAVSVLAQFQLHPNKYCPLLVKRVLGYLKGTTDYGLCYEGFGSDSSAIVDFDYARDKTDRRSATGYVISVAKFVIAWGARKQKSVALSTCEAEYYALSKVSQVAIWLQNILSQIGLTNIQPTIVQSDNCSAIEWALSTKNYAQLSKHIDVGVHFTWDLVRQKETDVNYITSKNNDADSLTNPLGDIKFEKTDKILR